MHASVTVYGETERTGRAGERQTDGGREREQEKESWGKRAGEGRSKRERDGERVVRAGG